MSLLDLDTTINKYLEIINKNILEPYLISTNWEAIEDGTSYKTTVDLTFTHTNGPIKSGTGADDYLKTKFTDGNEDQNYFKIKQVTTGKAAAITNTLNTTVLGNAVDNSINSVNLANNFDTDSDGLIYYTNTSSVKVYDLKQGNYFINDGSSSTNPSKLAVDDGNGINTNNTYYDYFVRFKVLKYIKDHYVDTKESNLTDTITNQLNAGTITGLESLVHIEDTALITKMLHFLEFINIKNNDKFEATVNCLYYYYYIALLEYNTIFCNKNLTYFAETNTGINTQLTKLKPTDGNYEYESSNDSDLILSSLIAIFESLIDANNGTNNLINSIFVNSQENSTVYNLITKLLKLHYDVNANDDRKIKLYQIENDDDSSGYTMIDGASVEQLGNTPKYQLRLKYQSTRYTLTSEQVRIIESLPVGGNIYGFINDYQYTLATGKSIFNYSSAIADIKDLNDFLDNLSSDGTELYKKALDNDKTDSIITGVDSISSATINNANTKLTQVKTALGNILEHYEKANKLNEILGNINDAYDSIKATTENTTIQDENIAINDTLVNITNADNSYKENVDKYKTKNNELNNILKNNLYNNIFLYITIIVLILICLGLIYINNHKASLKTQYSIMLIAFLLLYYIIYTNVTVNITETFQDIVLKSRKSRNDLITLSTSVHMYLYSLTTASKAYKESLKKEKNKYDGFAKSSNSKLNNLELVLNDEFINAIKSKELVKFLILFTAICIISYIVYTNTEDPTTTSIIFIILFVIILAIYFYNINLMTRTKADTKYWNHRMVMK
tara:strand:+ start:6662 stop:9028 length:2367 start_codon:yes stop_codon:yes gene_type:complete